MIYFIKSESGHLKIGFSKDKAELRLSNLQIGCPFKLRLLAMLNGDREQERLIHNKFKHLKVNGEWFIYKKEILNFIQKPFKIDSPPKSHREKKYAIPIPILDIPLIYDQLKKKYRTHEKVASLLGITGRHYVRIRKGMTKPKKSLVYLLDHLLRQN